MLRAMQSLRMPWRASANVTGLVFTRSRCLLMRWDQSTFSPTAECYGIFAQYRFRCVLGELGQFREPVPGSVSGTGSGKPGSGPEALFWIQKVASPRFRRLRYSMGSKGLGSVPEVWTEPVLGTGFREPEVLRRFRVPEIPFPRF